MTLKNTLKKLRSFFLGTLVLCFFSAKIQAQTGESLNFDGGNDYVQIASQSFGTNWSVETWIKPSNIFSIWNSVLGQSHWFANHGFVIAIQNGSVFVNGPGSNGSNGVNLTTSITANVWTHVAVTYNNGIWAFYKNGLLVGTQVAPFTNSTNPFYLGTRTDNTNSTLVDFYQGDLDEVRIWNITRTQCEIQAYLGCEIPTTATGLVANYHFNQGIGNGINLFITTLTDAAGSNTGSLNGGLGYSLLGGTTSNWLTTGSPASGNVAVTVSSPEINVTGNSVNITDGDVSSSTTNFTDFNGQPTRTFVIQSLGSSTLNVGTPVFTGANASEFSVTVIPASALAATTGSTSFVVAFTPTSVGTKSAVLNLYNSDCTSEAIYDFVITATAVTGSALNFDGVNDYVETGANLAELGQGDFTIEAWIKTTSAAQGIVTCANTNTTWETGEKSFYIDAAGIPMFVGWGNNYIVGNVAVNNGVWHHVAVVWDYNGGIGSFGKMYVDGVDQTAGSSYAGNNTNIGTFKIGKQNYGAGEAPNNFNGSIDEVRIWDRALCLPEIIHNMTCELPSPASQLDLNGYYQFNSGVAFGTNTAVTTASDAAVFTNNGTLTNFTLTGGTTSNWVSPGGVTNGSNCAVYLYPEINIQGNAITVNNGDMAPSVTDHTDFGYVNLGTTLSRTFVIQNTGTAVLSISAYSLSGANAGDFTITTNPGASVGAAGNTSIVISYSASTTGLKTASLTIASNDCDEGVYRFVINATGVVPAAALNFDGVNDYVQMADPNFGTSDCTIETWFNTSLGGGYLITTRSSEPGPSGNWFAISVGSGTNSGSVGLELAASTGTYAVLTTAPGCFTPGTWSHLAVVRSGSQFYIYVNGILRASATEPVTRNFVTGNNVLRLGGWVNFNAAWYNGSLDEVRLWSAARTQCEIQSYMNCEIPSAATNLVGNYHFNQGYNALSNSTITTVTDVSGSGRTGSIVNFSLSGVTSNWVAPGSVVSGYTTTVPPIAEIDVRGNGNSITDGNTGSSTLDFTDFNGVNTRTFTIHNTIGGGTLNIGNLFLTGANASQFAITTLPSSSVVGIGSTSFVVVFTPTSTGVKSATININNNDCSEPLFDFVITATAVAGGALTFDGINDKIDINGILDPQSTNYSLECWFKINSDASRPTLFKHAAATGTGRSHLFVSNTLHTLGTITGGITLTGTTTISPGIWYHAAYTWNGTTRKLYLNGILEAYDNNILEPSTGSDWTFGMNASSNFLDGSMDEIRIWNTERSQCEIQTYKDCEIPTTASGLLANYHFNQGIASGNNSGINILSDAAGSNTASVINFSLSGLSSNWTNPGGVISGYTTTSAPTATLTVYGNGNTVPMGITTSTTNYTDFDLATNRTFLVHNLGVSPLYVNAITFSGANASNFSVTSLPTASISGSSNSPFIISFTPTAVGSQSAIVNIISNDCTNPTFSFVITASTSPASALAFDGANDYVEAPHIAAIMINSVVTVEAWANPSTNSGIQYIVSKGTNDLTDGQYGIVLINGVPQYHLYNGGHIGVTAVNYTTTPGVWAHYAGTWDGTTLKLYINGVLNASGTYTGTMPANTGALQIGRLSPGGYWSTASIDEVRIWNIARTQCEIQTFMNAEIPSTAPGLMANYHFNHGIPSGSNATYSVLTDASANNNHGVLYNMTLNGSSSNWVSPSSITNGFTTAVAPTASIAVSGNGNNIPQSTATFGSNNTDFGTNTARTFSIYNAGGGTLNINAITFTGPNAAQFSVTTLPLNSVTTGTTGFVITLTPTNTGISTATVNISSNDCTNPTYSFVITASTIPASALAFDGANDYIQFADPNLGASDFTLEQWIKPNVPQNAYLLTTRTNEGGQAGNWFALSMGVNGNLGLELGGSPGSGAFSANPYASMGTATNVIGIGNWNHIAVVRAGNSLKLYVNGVERANLVTSITNTLTTGNNIFRFGGAVNFNNQWFNGSLDEIRIWNTARSQCQIQTFMNCEIPTTAAGLVANYHFNQGVPSGPNTPVNTLTDAAGANTGTLTGFTLTGSVSNWVSPSSIVNGFSTSLAPTATIAVSGNGNNVPQSTATFGSNNTDFGTNAARTFSIYNAGTGTLNINAITFTGPNAAQFSVTTLPLASVTTGSTGFVITLTPTNTGISTATVNISSNDCTNPTYSFVITASTSPASALDFDNNNDYVNLGTGLTTLFDPLNTITLEAWVNPTSTIGLGSIVGNWQSPVSDMQFLLQRTFDRYSLHIDAGAGYLTLTSAPNTTSLNVWQHVAGVWDGSEMRLYINGVLQGVLSNTGSSFPTRSNNVLIGGNNVNEQFTGSIDEVRIWTVARNQCQIQTFMNCEIPTNATGLVANYHFNQGIPSGANTSVNTLIDAAGANTGTLTNFSLLTGSFSNWVAPSSIANGFTTAVAPTASMVITGNGIAIAAGSTAPLLSNFTDFGTASTRTFVIQRTGSGTLYVNAPVTVTGVNASDFSITAQPSSSVTTGTTNFIVSFIPTALGTRSAIVVVNSSDCGTPNYSFVITATAVVGSALNFDGTDDFIDCGTASNLDITIGTWEAWVNLSTLSTNSRIFFKENADGFGSGTYESYFLAANGKFQADIKIGATNYSVTSVTSPLTNTWYHVAVTFDGLSLKMYINGILEVTNALTIGAMNPGTGHLSLGASYANPASSALTGNIDEARLWNRALCQNEIQAQMNCELNGSEPGLILYYKLNAGIANGVNTGITSVTDVAGGDNTGTLSSFSLSGLNSNWVAPGAVISGSSCAAFTAPEINLVSNATTILDGDNTPSVLDNTDFGNISSTGVVVKTYTIQNTGASNLTVSSITMSGADASSFTVSSLSPASPVAGGSSAVFSITFAPTSAGTKSAVVNITNNDCDEAIYDFVVTGTSTVGAAFTFDGTDDYINCGNILTASYTKEAWVKFSTSSNGNNFLSAGNVTSGSALWAPGIYNYSLSAGHDGAWNQVQDNVAMIPGTWYHIAVTYDAASSTMVLYKNGVVVSTNTNVLPFTGTSPLHIGAFSGTFVTTGSMDEVRIWNRPLCQAEIQNNMNCEIPTTASGLIANYHFNQGVANGSNTAITSLTDASGSANNGTLTNIAATGTISNWVAVGGVTSGSSCAAYFTPEINLVGNAQSINDGDMTPSSADHTDFGGVCVNGQIVRTFTIQNTGTASLSVSSITLGGVNASLSNIGPLTPASPIAPGNSAVFSVSFSPTSAGVKTTTLYITNSDCNEGVYDFAMTGTCNALPTVTASATNSVICEGASTMLNGLGADTYTWTGSVLNGVSFTPSITLTYSVTGTNTLTGCTSTNSAAQTITVNINPTVTANAVNTVICEGATTTLTAFGAANYTWNPGAITNVSISPSPSVTTAYSVVATSTDGCTSVNTVVITVSVNALPTVTALTSNSVVCLNFTTSLNGAGADTYTWTGGVTNGVSFAPTSTQTYSVAGTNTLSGCVSTNVAVQTITVDPLPTVTISTSNSVICEGNSTTLTATGANTYTWNPGLLNGINITPSPTLFTTYTLSGTSAAGCTNTNLAVQSISVNTLPTVSANISSSVICAGNTITLNGSGAATYTWTDGAPDGTAFSPTATTTYTLSGTNSAGCTNTNLAVASLTVNALPQLSVTATNSVLCFGDQTSLNASGASTYSWSGGIANNQVFTPTVTTTYTLSGTDGNNCENTAITTITVNALPQLTVSSTNSIACEAQSTTLTVSGAATYSWNTGATTADIVITPTATSIFSINATDAYSCTNFIVYTQSVTPCPGTFSTWAVQGNVSCAGKNDGYIAVKYNSSYANAQVNYVWANSNLCADESCDSIAKLDAGTYTITVKYTYTLNSILVKTDSVILGPINILDENGQCEVKVFSGITANNDGINDVLAIENIDQFPNNSVSVYNRWGQLVFEKKGYNNSNVVWPVGDEGSKLISNTYFYVIDLGNGSKLIKGWVELIKN